MSANFILQQSRRCQTLEQSERFADVVISAHVMNGQHFKRTIKGYDIPNVIAGAGGYYHLRQMRCQPSGVLLALAQAGRG
jgi:hypothetical protein